MLFCLFSSFFAGRPHVASTKRTFEISDEIYRRFESYGFKASFHNYTTILGYSKRDDPNMVYVKHESGIWKYYFTWLLSILCPENVLGMSFVQSTMIKKLLLDVFCTSFVRCCSLSCSSYNIIFLYIDNIRKTILIIEKEANMFKMWYL